MAAIAARPQPHAAARVPAVSSRLAAIRQVVAHGAHTTDRPVVATRARGDGGDDRRYGRSPWPRSGRGWPPKLSRKLSGRASGNFFRPSSAGSSAAELRVTFSAQAQPEAQRQSFG
jgi:hypothetical protein